MDAVVKGLIGGSAISLILFFGGVITMSTGFGETFKNPNTIGLWLITLTALTAGQIFVTSMIVSAFAEAQPQTSQSTSG
jgi:hypothetical protein